MALTEHLRELRNRLFACLAVLLISTFVGLSNASRIIQLLLDIGHRYNYSSPNRPLVQLPEANRPGMGL